MSRKPLWTSHTEDACQQLSTVSRGRTDVTRPLSMTLMSPVPSTEHDTTRHDATRRDTTRHDTLPINPHDTVTHRATHRTRRAHGTATPDGPKGPATNFEGTATPHATQTTAPLPIPRHSVARRAQLDAPATNLHGTGTPDAPQERASHTPPRHRNSRRAPPDALHANPDGRAYRTPRGHETRRVANTVNPSQKQEPFAMHSGKKTMKQQRERGKLSARNCRHKIQKQGSPTKTGGILVGVAVDWVDFRRF